MRRYILMATVLVFSASACSDENNPIEPQAITYTQIDYMGRPAISTVFLPSSQKDDYNRSIPATHRMDFKSSVTGFLTTVAGYTVADADALADVLLPDILTIDLDQPSAYLNGRTPQDDVTTASLMLVFGAGTPLSDDNVDANDKAYPASFPFLASPHVP